MTRTLRPLFGRDAQSGISKVHERSRADGLKQTLLFFNRLSFAKPKQRSSKELAIQLECFPSTAKSLRDCTSGVRTGEDIHDKIAFVG